MDPATQHPAPHHHEHRAPSPIEPRHESIPSSPRRPSSAKHSGAPDSHRSSRRASASSAASSNGGRLSHAHASAHSALHSAATAAAAAQESSTSNSSTKGCVSRVTVLRVVLCIARLTQMAFCLTTIINLAKEVRAIMKAFAFIPNKAQLSGIVTFLVIIMVFALLTAISDAMFLALVLRQSWRASMPCGLEGLIRPFTCDCIWDVLWTAVWLALLIALFVQKRVEVMPAVNCSFLAGLHLITAGCTLNMRLHTVEMEPQQQQQLQLQGAATATVRLKSQQHGHHYGRGGAYSKYRAANMV